MVVQVDRFWSKVAKSDACWEWTASTTYNGYGRFRTPTRTLSAHRVSWELHYGEIPSGLFVCHHCDNKRCVRPGHLFLGTNRDNQLDASNKGRSWRGGGSHFPQGEFHISRTHPELLARGERQGRAKLTDNAVKTIRTAFATTVFAARGQRMQLADLFAKEFGVTRAAIKAVCQARTWRHVA